MRSLLLATLVALAPGCSAPGADDADPATLRFEVRGARHAGVDSSAQGVVIDGFSDGLTEALLADHGFAALVPPATNGAELEPDILIQPVFRGRMAFTNDGLEASAWGTTFLWLTTWVGGLMIADRSFSFGEDYEIEFEISSGDYPGVNTLRFPIRPSAESFSFLERDLRPVYTVLSIIWPPFLLGFDRKRTSSKLTARLHRSSAAELAAYLKGEFELDSLKTGSGGMVGLAAREVPGAQGEKEVQVTGWIGSRRRIGSVALVLDGNVTRLEGDALAEGAGFERFESKDGLTPDVRAAVAEFAVTANHLYRVDTTLPRGAGDDPNRSTTVVIEARSDQLFSRTVLIR